MRAVDGTHPRPTTAAGQYRATQRAVDTTGRALAQPVRPPSCKVQPFDEERWPAGTLWLDTSITGPFGSHPLKVRLYDGSYTHVAWLVPAV